MINRISSIVLLGLKSRIQRQLFKLQDSLTYPWRWSLAPVPDPIRNIYYWYPIFNFCNFNWPKPFRGLFN